MPRCKSTSLFYKIICLYSAALQLIEKEVQNSKVKPNILLVFDDVITHNFKEKKVFDLAKQPFAPINIHNEI